MDKSSCCKGISLTTKKEITRKFYKYAALKYVTGNFFRPNPENTPVMELRYGSHKKNREPSGKIFPGSKQYIMDEDYSPQGMNIVVIIVALSIYAAQYITEGFNLGNYVIPYWIYSRRKTSCSRMIKMTESNERSQSAPTSRNSSGDRMRDNNQEFRHDLNEFTNQEMEVHDETHERIMEEPVPNPMRTEPSVSLQAETLGVNGDTRETIRLQLNGEEEILTPTGTEGEYLWTSRNGTCKDIKIPCAYHMERQVPAALCFIDAKEHCLECSSSVKLAEPVEICMGNHQWKPEAMEEAETQ